MKISVKKIKEKIWDFEGYCAERIFTTSLAAIFLALILGGILFYKYDILLDKSQMGPGVVSIKLQTQNYQKITEKWQQMQNNFSNADLKNYFNPFIGN
jgi:hypothetical protein